jgi:pimeloyl-ACP methyl ester carboxylesterase
MTELYWLIRPSLEEWAEVASYDPPGVGNEAPREGPVVAGIARRGLEELDRLGWERCVLAADAYGALAVVELAGLALGHIAGLALGHATLSFQHGGPRPAIDPAVNLAATRMMETDYRGWLRQDVAVWDVRRGPAGQPLPDALVDEIVKRVPRSVGLTLSRKLEEEAEEYGSLEPRLRALGLPLLLAKHRDCVTFTAEGFADAVAAFPEARRIECDTRPTVSDEFADALREFCARIL